MSVTVYKKVLVDHPRGVLENGSGNFHRFCINASPEDYDYCNWSMSELEQLRDALTEFLKEVKTQHIII